MAADVAPKPRPAELATMAIAGMLLVAASPQVLAIDWTPKVAIALLVVGPGLVALIVAAGARDRAAVAGLVFVAIASGATLFSPAPMMSLVGLYNHGTGLIFVVLVVGMWALGRRYSDVGAQRLGLVLLAAAFLNAAMAWLQSSRVMSGDLFNLVDGRPPAFLGNPVHATALFLGAFALVAERWRSEGTRSAATRERSFVLLGVAALLASALELAGGRIGIVVLVVLLVVVSVRVGLRRTVPLVIAVLLGLSAATFAAPQGTGAASRVAASGDSALSGRIDRWRLAQPAIEARPVLGIGPGLYRRATSRFSTVASAKAFGADSLNIDAHNLVVEYLVTTGVLGAGALVAWLVLAALGARGELAWFAAVGAVSLLLQPEFVGLTPVLALALGVAKRGPPIPLPRAAMVMAGAMATAGIFLGVALIRGDAFQRQAVADLVPSVGRSAARALPMWPEPANAESRAYSYEAISKRRPEDWSRALAAARDAHRRDPSDPSAANYLGGLELAQGSAARARVAFAAARYWNPQSVTALVGLASIASSRGDHRTSDRLCAQAKVIAHRLHCPVDRPVKGADGG
jgi:Lipid A core - O-antigen ligase and related enzymes